MKKIVNNYYKRFLMDELKKWIDRKEIFAITGARQSGKTTLLKMLASFLIEEKKVNNENIVFLTFEDRETMDKFARSPQEFIKSYISKENEKYYFFIDEFQYLKGGGQKLKLLYDLFENIKFIITGSSSLELKNNKGKFLVGRMFSFNLYPFSFGEFLSIKNERLFKVWQETNISIQEYILKNKNYEAKKDDIFIADINKYYEEYAIWGGYPAVVLADSCELKKIVLKNIFDTYITKDIIGFLRMENESSFVNLFLLLAKQAGNLLNYNNLSIETGTYFKELKRHLTILEETYLLKILRPFYKNLSTELKKNPKIYFTDTGIRNYSVNNLSSLSKRQDAGSLLENVLFNQLKINLPSDLKINFWRTLAKAEIDFILSMSVNLDNQVPIESKYSAFKKPSLTRSFQSFLEHYNPKNAIVATKDYSGHIKKDQTEVKFIPIAYF